MQETQSLTTSHGAGQLQHSPTGAAHHGVHRGHGSLPSCARLNNRTSLLGRYVYTPNPRGVKAERLCFGCVSENDRGYVPGRLALTAGSPASRARTHRHRAAWRYARSRRARRCARGALRTGGSTRMCARPASGRGAALAVCRASGPARARRNGGRHPAKATYTVRNTMMMIAAKPTMSVGAKTVPSMSALVTAAEMGSMVAIMLARMPPRSLMPCI